MLGSILSTVGLFLDIIGVIMLFIYGIPENVDRRGSQHLILEEADETELDKARHYDVMSFLAVTSLVVGFVCQIAGQWT